MPHVFIQAGWTALMIAASKGDERICKLLLEHGADLTKNDCVRVL
jgi:ankyrin repeat protein